jgi:hypothetical protein
LAGATIVVAIGVMTVVTGGTTGAKTVAHDVS